MHLLTWTWVEEIAGLPGTGKGEEADARLAPAQAGHGIYGFLHC